MKEQLTSSETKEVVTPYAFSVSPDLLGKPLASPSRRGIAMIIDLFLISVLSTISALIFAAFVALTFFRADVKIKQRAAANQKNAWHYSRVLLRSSGAILIFFVAFSIVQGFDSKQNNDDAEDSTSVNLVAPLVIVLACSDDLPCVHRTGLVLASSLANKDFTEDEFLVDMRELIDETQFSQEEKENTVALLLEEFQRERIALAENKAIAEKQADLDTLAENESAVSPLAEDEVSLTPSIIAWAKGVMSDFGLGLGWAALYFSVFTAWYNGQTIGKKVCSINVVRLDGKIPTLWESFNRYGGYVAGFATGLLGFLQIFWDPNRQAIHDKISETLVLRVKKVIKLKTSKPEQIEKDVKALENAPNLPEDEAGNAKY